MVRKLVVAASVMFASALVHAPIGVDAQADVINVTFDGPGYVAGAVPPSPWWQEYGSTHHSISADAGYGGTQALLIPKATDWTGVAYDLPTPLTADMGPVSVSILFMPTGGHHPQANFLSFGGMHIGRGEKRFDSATYKGLIFRRVSASNGVYGPGAGYGSLVSPLTLNQWYELTYEFNAAWDTLTLKAGPVGGATASMTTAWDGGSIDRIWLLGTDDGNPAAFDNLVAVPEPATFGILIMGGLTLLKRRRTA